jgi:hypothetical protein
MKHERPQTLKKSSKNVRKVLPKQAWRDQDSAKAFVSAQSFAEQK